MSWSSKINITNPNISGIFYSDNLSYDNYKQQNTQSTGYTNKDGPVPCTQFCGAQGCTLSSNPSKCPDAPISCPNGTSVVYSKKSGDVIFQNRASFFCSDCDPSDRTDYSICVLPFVCYKCVCNKTATMVCGTNNFQKTLNLNPFSVDVIVKEPSTKERVIDVNMVENSWTKTGNSVSTARKGNVGVNISTNFSDNFLLTADVAKSMVTWINQWSGVKSSSTPDPLLCTLLQNYLKVSIVTSAIYTDFTNQFYIKYKDKNSRQFSVKSVYSPGDITWWENIVENIKCYVKLSINTLYPTDTYFECLYNEGQNTFGKNIDGTDAVGFKKTAIIHPPMPDKDIDNYIITFTLSYNDYQNGLKYQGGLGQYCTDLMNKVLQDDQVLYNGKSNQRGGPVFIETDKYKPILIYYKISNGTKTGEISFPIIDFPQMTDSQSKDFYIDYIVGVRITLKVYKWSPMLLLYFLNTGIGLTFTSKACQQIQTDTNNIIPQSCISYLASTDKDKYNIFLNNCKNTMSFGVRNSDFDTPTIAKQLLISSSENCSCTNGRIAPDSEKNSEAGINANLCFNTKCKNSDFRKQFIISRLGDESKCKNYCQYIYDWLKTSDYMQHSNEIDPELFKQICGDVKPTNRNINKNVLVSSIIISVLILVLTFLIMKNHNLNIYLIIFVILSLLSVFTALTIFLSNELAGQNWLSGPQGGPYNKNCLSKKFNISLPSEFCPDDLGAECIFNEDCKSTNCNSGCIAQVCTPGENQKREKYEEKNNSFPIVLYVLVVTICIVLPQIIIQGMKLTKFKQLTENKIIILYATIIILSFIPFYFILFKGHVTYKYSNKCVDSEYNVKTSLLNNNSCNLTKCS